MDFVLHGFLYNFYYGVGLLKQYPQRDIFLFLLFPSFVVENFSLVGLLEEQISGVSVLLEVDLKLFFGSCKLKFLVLQISMGTTQPSLTSHPSHVSAMAALLSSTLLPHSSSWHPLTPIASIISNHPPLKQNTPTKPPQASLLSPSRTFTATAFVAVGFSLASALAFPEFASAIQFSLQEPPNALSLPTWAIHVSSIVEWVTAMGLVWQYGEKPGYESWKGLSWGMRLWLGY